MLNPTPLISVVVPTYQRCAAIQRLLRALEHQTLRMDLFEVIVVIDGSSDGTREQLDTFRTAYPLTPLWQSNQGRAAACNRGILAASGELIVILDDDMEPPPDLLEAHLKLHQQIHCLAVVGAVPVQLDPSSPPVMKFIGEKFNQHLAKLSQPGYQLNLRDFYSGNFSIPRSVLLDAGMFEAQFNAYGNEDLELFWKLRKSGIKLIYSAEAYAIQHYEKDFPALAKDNLAKGKTSLLFARLHPEVIPEIKLSTYDQESLKWRVMRSALLFVSRIWKGTPDLIIQIMSWLEKRNPMDLFLYYRLSLDYFYWLGVRNAEQ